MAIDAVWASRLWIKFDLRFGNSKTFRHGHTSRPGEQLLKPININPLSSKPPSQTRPSLVLFNLPHCPRRPHRPGTRGGQRDAGGSGPGAVPQRRLRRLPRPRVRLRPQAGQGRLGEPDAGPVAGGRRRVESHTRAGEENWPLLTNFGISTEDTLTLTQGAKHAEIKRLKAQRPGKFSSEQKFLFDAKESSFMEQGLRNLESLEARKHEVMARLIDLANGNSRAVFNANLEKALLHFGRHDGDTGSPEVQGSP